MDFVWHHKYIWMEQSTEEAIRIIISATTHSRLLMLIECFIKKKIIKNETSEKAYVKVLGICQSL